MPQQQTSILGSSAAVVLKTGPGYLRAVIVQAPGSTAGSVNDSATTGGATAGNTLLAIPTTAVAGSLYIELNLAFSNGLAFNPGTGMICNFVFD